MCKYKNILVYSLVNLGDVLLSTSAVALLKQVYPNAKITMMVRPAVKAAVEHNSVIDEVLIYDYKRKNRSIQAAVQMIKEIKRRKFDLSISFDRKLRPALITWLAGIPTRVGPSRVFDDVSSKITMLYTDTIEINHDLANTLQADTYQEIVRKFTGCKGKSIPIMANIFPENEIVANALLASLPKGRLSIGLCVKGTFPLKTWPKEYFSEVVDRLNHIYDARFFIIGALEDKDYADEVAELTKITVGNFCGKTSLVDLAAILKKTDLFITVDTGAAHIAATTGVKMIVVYGCTSPNRWHPINSNSIALTTNEPCCPCKIAADQCPTPVCLRNITVDIVIEKCNELLGSGKA